MKRDSDDISALGFRASQKNFSSVRDEEDISALGSCAKWTSCDANELHFPTPLFEVMMI
jgi:hypothetical protein